MHLCTAVLRLRLYEACPDAHFGYRSVRVPHKVSRPATKRALLYIFPCFLFCECCFLATVRARPSACPWPSSLACILGPLCTHAVPVAQRRFLAFLHRRRGEFSPLRVSIALPAPVLDFLIYIRVITRSLPFHLPKFVASLHLRVLLKARTLLAYFGCPPTLPYPRHWTTRVLPAAPVVQERSGRSLLRTRTTP